MAKKTPEPRWCIACSPGNPHPGVPHTTAGRVRIGPDYSDERSPSEDPR
jgi:hypothetical protein